MENEKTYFQGDKKIPMSPEAKAEIEYWQTFKKSGLIRIAVPIDETLRKEPTE